MPEERLPGSRSRRSQSPKRRSGQPSTPPPRPETAAGVVQVRPFLPLRVAAIVRQHLTDDARTRFERSIAMRSAWYGGTVGVCTTSMTMRNRCSTPFGLPLHPLTSCLRWASHRSTRSRSPGRACSPPAPRPCGAASRCTRGAATGSPSCSAVRSSESPRAGCSRDAARSTCCFARLHAGLPLDPAYLASLGHGGLLGKEAAWRIPPYEAALDDDPDEG